MVADPVNPERSRWQMFTGQSGHPASPHYDDLIPDWSAGRYHPMPFSRKAVESATTERITLSP